MSNFDNVEVKPPKWNINFGSHGRLIMDTCLTDLVLCCSSTLVKKTALWIS